MDRIEKLRQQYYEAIKLLQNEEDILNALPKPEYENFFTLISGIINMLEDELKKIQSMEETNSEMKEYIDEEINLIKLKIDICNKLLYEAQDKKQIEEESIKTSKKSIIFATTDRGNIYIENDLKSIPEEYLGATQNLLERLQDGETEENVEKGRQFTSANKKIAKIHELKAFKVRLFYKILSSDTVYVLGAKMKKSNWDARDQKEIVDRASHCNKQYEQLKNLIKDPTTKEEFIKEHEKILIGMLEHMEHKKR